MLLLETLQQLRQPLSAEAGADGAKVGIGPGSICTTRVAAGVGYPQFLAILEVSKILERKGIPLIADGSVDTPRYCKGNGAGAQSVMLGSMWQEQKSRR